jgi:hypothetical protein
MTADTFQFSNSLYFFKMVLMVKENAFLVLKFSRKEALGMTILLHAAVIFNAGNRPGIVIIRKIIQRVQHVGDRSEFMAFQAAHIVVIGGAPLIIIGLHVMAGFAGGRECGSDIKENIGS